jgi:hypothetical protein
MDTDERGVVYFAVLTALCKGKGLFCNLLIIRAFQFSTAVRGVQFK